MRRAQLLKMTGVTATGFNNLALRNLLPFKAESRSKGWGSYTADDAFRLALMVELTAVGWAQPIAVGAVRAEYDQLIESAITVSLTQPRPWLFGQFTTVTRGDDSSARLRVPLIARVGDLDTELASQLAKVSSSPSEVGQVSVVSATHVLARVVERAAANDLNDARLTLLAKLMCVT